MTSAQKNPGSDENQHADYSAGAPGVATALAVRLWTYEVNQDKLHDFNWIPEGAIADVFRTFIADHSGKIAEAQQNILLAQFNHPAEALTAAKSLQERLRLFNLDPSVQRIVAAVVVHSWLSESAAATIEAVAPQMVVSLRLLGVSSPLQILATRGIFELTKDLPDFHFTEEPIAGLEEAGIPGDMYELLWTDAESYVAARAAILEKAVLEPQNPRYTIQGEIGRGSMGVVYKAYDNVIGRTVALKTISFGSHEMNRHELVDRLKLEAKAAGSLDHPNIITIYDVAEEEDLIYLSMQFVEGTTLASLLAERKILPTETVLGYIEQICNAVTFAHARGVIHRDLKPSNLMLTSQGLIKILDFGIAKLGDAGLTQAGMVIGTPDYMAPEQAAGRRIDHRADIFALGAVFYEMFTGEKAFDGQSITSVLYKVMNEEPIPPSAIDPLLPRAIDGILQRALAKDPAQRFQTCAEMRDAFREHATLAGPVSSTGSFVPARSPFAAIRKFTASVLSRANYLVWSGVAVFLIALVTLIAVHRKSSPAVPTASSPAFARNSATTTNIQPSASPTPPVQAAFPEAAPAVGPDTGKARIDKKDASTSAGISSPAAQTAAHADSQSETSSEDDGGGIESPSRKSAIGKRTPQTRHSSAKHERADTKSSGGDNTFDASEIPALLEKANTAAGRGDYGKAKAAFRVVLKLDTRNAAALDGLRRVEEAEKEPQH